MNEEDKKKIKRNLVALEKKLKLDDQFQRLSVQKRMFSQEMMDDIMCNKVLRECQVVSIAKKFFTKPQGEVWFGNCPQRHLVSDAIII
ncbi:hypothetical protein QYM36_012057, partial [Artemia franciscana]